MKRLMVLFTLFYPFIFVLPAQTFHRFNPPFSKDGKILTKALVGGLNNPQLSAADLNGDGRQDLYIFDRTGNVHLPFLWEEDHYVFAPSFAAYFPPLNHWVLLRDFNQDGAVDIFAYSDVPGVPGVIVYQGFYEEGHLAFERFGFDAPNNLIDFPLPSGGRTQLFVSSIDYPAVDDLDCDGDMDVLTFDPAGGFVELYENQSVEMGYGLDSLLFLLEENCWGGFFESGFTPEVDLAGSPGVCVTDLGDGVVVRHAGSTLLTLDADGDADRELVLGDLSFAALNFLHNAGTCEEAWMDSQNFPFPTDKPVDLPFFPAAFYLDLNGDGVKDFTASPNAAQEGENVEVLWFYENRGAANQLDLVFQTPAFLVEDMLDAGSGAFPAFVDYNADGRLDLVIGNGYRFRGAGQRSTSLQLFENTGTPSSPAFELVEEDYLGLSRFNPEGYQFIPAFGDLDGDGDLDIVVGEERGALFFAENAAGPSKPVSFGPWQYPFAGIDVGQSSAPAIEDLNGDNLPDLVIGERNGNLNFFPNQGSLDSPSFHPDPESAPNIPFLGKVDARVPGSFVGFSTPFFAPAPDGSKRLLLGTDAGQLELYQVSGDDLQEAFPQLSANWGNIRQGSRTRAALADIDADGFLEAAVGNARGGIAMYRTDLKADQTVAVETPVRDPSVEIFPNPAGEVFYIALRGIAVRPEKLVRIYNTTGQLVRQHRGSGEVMKFPTANLPPGLYFVVVQVEELGWTGRLIVDR